jgi:CDGSH-type Zn-finger protein
MVMTEPVIAQKEPCEFDVEEGQEYWWCACGKSASQPFCDGSHKGTGLSPLQYTAKRNQTVYFCGCKKTANQPLCDGTHSDL